MKRYLIFILLILFNFSVFIGAQNTKKESTPEDSIHISLLTCAPGDEIYTLFGHTAIRVKIANQNIDRVYNYGLFNFNTPNFVFRFALGKTDYQLGATTFPYFLAEYEYYNRAVWEQTLNLTLEEKNRLIHLLNDNNKPENRIYRYNFFYDNCATKPRDIISESIIGDIKYTGNINETFRSIIHQHTENHLWSEFGIDLCLGSPADKKVSISESMFAPFYLMALFNDAKIIDKEGNERTLIKDKKTIFSPKEVHTTKKTMLSPLVLFSLFFCIILFISYKGIKKRKSYWGIDLLLLSLYGIAGCVLGFLSFISTHPAVYPNYLLLVFNPIHLLAIPFALRRIRKKQKSYYLIIYCILLTFFTVLSPLIPQGFNLAILPLTLCLIIRGINHLILAHKI